MPTYVAPSLVQLNSQLFLPIGISFQVWANNIRHPADLGIKPQFVHGCTFVVLDFAQRFKDDIETYLVAELEAIDNCLRDSEHRYLRACDIDLLNALGHRRSEHANYT